MSAPVTIAFARILPTRSLAAAWAAVSDTDRFNRDAGLGFSFTEERDDDGRLRRYGHARRLGLTLTWEDEPFELDPPHRLVSVRRFVGGPLAHLRTTIVLTPGDEGVGLDYRVELTPRHSLMRWVVALDASLSIRPMLARTLDATAARLGGEALPQPSAPLLSALGTDALGDRLARLIEHGDPREADRIRPVALAASWEVSATELIDRLITGVARGAVEVRYDLLCPSCHGAKVRLASLDLGAVQPHCASCQVRYDGALPDGIEVTFRPAPSVRTIAVPLDCINSPAHTPHVLTRVAIPAGAQVELRPRLEPGAYLVRLADLPTTASIEVREGLRATTAALELNDAGLAPQILRLGPGKARLLLRNRTGAACFVQLETRWRPEGALSLGRLLEHDQARQVLDLRALPEPGAALHEHAWLAIDGPAALHAADMLSPSGRITFDADRPCPIVHTAADGCALLGFPDLAAALLAANLLQCPESAMLLDRGAIALHDNGGTTLPLGPAAERIFARLRRIGAGRLGLADGLADDPELSRARLALDAPILRPSDGTGLFVALPPAAAPAPPVDTSPYPLGPEIARGGMGVVHATTDPETGEELAIKLLLPEHTADPSAVQRFYTEGALTARLDHPNLVRVVDVAARGRGAFMVMERLVGEELSDRLATQRRLPPAKVVALALQVLDALQATHDLAIVHRDIKPSNLFICQEPRPDLPKVIDFGIAVELSDALDPRAPILGTPRYLAPEQVERAPLDGRTDLYALGLVLYELLSGDIPFRAHNAQQLALVRLAVDPAPLHEVVPEVDQALSAVIMRALQVDPADRWPDAAAMADALREAAGA